MKISVKNMVLAPGALFVTVMLAAPTQANTDFYTLSIAENPNKLSESQGFAVRGGSGAESHGFNMLAQNNDIGPDGLKRRGDGTIDDDQPGVVRQNDDIGPDGLKRRGDGTIDDDQPGVGFGREHNRLIHSKERNREVLDDGTAVRTRTDTWVTPDGVLVRERSETRTVLPDGTKARERIDRRFDADGNIIRERIDVRDTDHGGRRDRVDSFDRPERMDRSGRPDRPERPDRPDDHSGRH